MTGGRRLRVGREGIGYRIELREPIYREVGLGSHGAGQSTENALQQPSRRKPRDHISVEVLRPVMGLGALQRRLRPSTCERHPDLCPTFWQVHKLGSIGKRTDHRQPDSHPIVRGADAADSPAAVADAYLHLARRELEVDGHGTQAVTVRVHNHVVTRLADGRLQVVQQLGL